MKSSRVKVVFGYSRFGRIKKTGVEEKEQKLNISFSMIDFKDV